MVEEQLKFKVKDISLAEWGRKRNRLGRGRNAWADVP